MTEETFLLYAALALAVVGCFVYAVFIYNGLILLKNNISKSWANVDVLLKQRSGELPNLVDVAKAYMKHERQLFENLTQLRTNFLQAKNLSDKIKADESISGTIKTLFAAVENYPDLKANQNFLHLQSRISGLENELADRREFFNDSVTQYNIRIASFPDIFFVKPLGFRRERLYTFKKADGL